MKLSDTAPRRSLFYGFVIVNVARNSGCGALLPPPVCPISF